MENIIWLKQTPEQPLFPDILWDRPENKKLAGKLLIVGGNLHSFAAVASSYSVAVKAGIGTVRIILPGSLQRIVGKLFPEAIFAPSTPSGSLAKTALAQLLDEAAWADGVMLAGDFGHNAETAILLESFAQKYAEPLAIAGDAADIFSNLSELSGRQKTLVACDLSKLQKAAVSMILIKHSMNLSQAVEALNSLTSKTKLALLTTHADHIIVSRAGVSSSTKGSQLDQAAVYAFVSWLQQPKKAFEAMTTGVFESLK